MDVRTEWHAARADLARNGVTVALFLFNVGLYLHIALTLYRGHA